MRLGILRLILGVVALAVVVLGAAKVLLPFVDPIVWAMILGLATWPAYRRLLGWLRGRENLAALIMTTVLVLVVVAPVIFLGLTLLREIEPVVRGAQEWAAGGKIEIPEWVKQIPGAEQHVQRWLERVGDPEARELWLSQSILPGERLVRWSRNVLQQIGVILLTVFTLFFVYRDGERLVREIGFLVDKIADGRSLPLLGAVRETVRAVFYGWLVTAAAQGLVSIFGYWIAGLRAPVLLGIATGLAALIPFGVGLVWIPAVASLALTGEWGRAVFLAAWSLAFVGLIDNFIRPKVISGPAKVPFILIFFGVMGGLLVYGALGMVLGPVLLAVLLALWRQAREALLDTGEVEP